MKKVKISLGTFICLIIIFVLVIVIGFLGCKLYIKDEINKNNEVSNVQNSNDTQITKNDEKQELTQEELKELEDYLNTEENNGFLTSSYSKIEDVNLTDVLICAVQKIGEFSNAIVEEYEKEYGFDIDTPVYKYNQDKVVDFIEEKTGVEFYKMNYDLSLAYNNKYNAYYIEPGGAVYNFVNSLSGYKEGNKYVVSGKYNDFAYDSNDENNRQCTTFTVVLKKSENGYIFVSNQMK